MLFSFPVTKLLPKPAKPLIFFSVHKPEFNPITMKKITLSAMLFSMITATLFATGPTDTPKHEFKTKDEEVVLEAERGSGMVLLYIQIKDIKQYDHILIERSMNDDPTYFNRIKYIDLKEEKVEADGILKKEDKYPVPASKDAYYRIKTVTTDGIARAYPAVLMPSVN